MNRKMSSGAFYLLSWTWGIILSSIGAIVYSIALLACLITRTAFKIEKHGYCYYLFFKEGWGAFNLGMFILSSTTVSSYTLSHEHGHAIQNCIFGPLMPFIISIPSAIRFHYRNIKTAITMIPPTTDYYSIWFEKQASELGIDYISVDNT